MKFSICADIMYGNMDFPDKIRNIKKNGFDTFEFWKWSNKNIDEIKNIINDLEMNVSCFCIDSKDDYKMNSIGNYMLNSDKTQMLCDITLQSIETAHKLGAKALIATVGDCIENLSYDEQTANVLKNIDVIKKLFEQNKMTLLVEPINRMEREKYLMPNAKQIAQIVSEINSPYVKILYDIYHQSMEDDFNITEMIDILSLIGHIHIADCPGRNEPGTGTINYRKIFDALKENNYNGFVGAEFVPSASEESAFELLKKLSL